MAAISFGAIAWAEPRAPALSEMEISVRFDIIEAGLDKALDLKLVLIHATDDGRQLTLTPDADDDGIQISPNDIILDQVDVDAVRKLGKKKVTLVGDKINFDAIADVAKLDIMAIVLSASYSGEEFYRLGWYVKHEYEDEELNKEENRPSKPDMSKCVRVVDIHNPLETKLTVDWGRLLDEGRQRTAVGESGDAKRRRLDGAGGTASAAGSTALGKLLDGGAGGGEKQAQQQADDDDDLPAFG